MSNNSEKCSHLKHEFIYILVYFFVMSALYFFIIYIFSEEGKTQYIPHSIYDLTFIIFIILSYCIQVSLNYFFDNNGMYHSISIGKFSSYFDNLFPFIQGSVVLIILLSILRHKFDIHIATTILYLFLFVVSDLIIICCAKCSSNDKHTTRIAEEFKKFCKRMLLPDFASFFALGLLCIAIFIVDISYKEKYFIMIGAIFIHLAITVIYYANERFGFIEYISNKASRLFRTNNNL